MAITRAQQAKQMLREGGRTGFFSAGLAAGDDISPGTSTSGGSKSGGNKSGGSGGGGGNDNRERYITNYSSKGKVKGGGKLKGLPGTDMYEDRDFSDKTDPTNRQIINRQRKRYQDQFTSKGIAPPGPNRKARQRALNFINKNMLIDYNRFGKYYDPNKFGVTKTGYPNFGFPNLYEGIASALKAGATLDEILENENMIPLGSGPSYEFDKIRDEFNKANIDRKKELLEQVGLKGLEDLKGTSYEMNPIPDLDIDSIRELASVQTTMQGAPLTGYQAGALKELKEGIQKRDNLLETGDTSNIFPGPPEPAPDDGPSDPCLGPNPPAYCFIGDKADETQEAVVTRNLSGLTPRIGGSIFDFTQFAADGGRIGLQEGGGIEQRLEQLGGDVTSAEQMLQQINQRLQTAESSLGSGGGGLGTLATLAGSNQPFNPMQTPPESLPVVQPRPGPFMGRPALTEMPGYQGPLSSPTFVGELKSVQPGDPGYRAPGPTILNEISGFAGETFSQVPEEFRSGFAEYMKDKPLQMGGQAISYVGLPGGNRVMFGDTGSAGTFRNYLSSIGFNPPGPLGQPLQSQGTSGVPALGFAEGGIANLDREAFLLGGIAKGLKKAVRGVKKLAKSPIGKAALLGIGGGFMGIGPFKGLATAKGLGFKNFMLNKVLGTPLGDITGTRTGGLLGLIKDNPMTSIFLTSLAAGAMTSKQDDGFNTDQYYADNKLDPNAPLNKRIGGSEFDFYGGQTAADGGRIGYEEAGAVMTEEDMEEMAKSPLYKGFKKMYGVSPDMARDNKEYEGKFKQFEQLFKKGYQEGGDVEPVAKKTLPLIDMDGMEKDYRETGGFVEMGRMEKADDVPARLSKNEFVFTADAVRNAGEGDIDKGAEVMYNMMKNLEAGGEVSEESQGLEGARKMFQTSQRLGEVI